MRDLKKEFLKYMMKNKFFYLDAMPAYIRKVADELNLTISDEELKEAAAMLLPQRRERAEEIFNVSRSFGLENEMPFIIH